MSSRDLASVELWQRSLARSRQRRRLSELGRKARRRRKRVSLALSAALAAGPVLPQGVAAADSSSGSGAATTSDSGDGTSIAATASRVVLELGSRGPLVAAAQRRLNDVLPFTHLAVDGIYGPLTRGAVMNFQRQHGLAATGALDVRTWASMFNAPVLIMGASGGSTSSYGAPTPPTATASVEQSSRRYIPTATATADASGAGPGIVARSADVGGSMSTSASASGRAAPSEATARSVTTAPTDTSGAGGASQLTATGAESGSAGTIAPAGAGGAPADTSGNPTDAGAAPAPASGNPTDASGAPATARGTPTDAGGAPANAGVSGTGSHQPSAAPSVTVVAPTNSTPQTSTYVLTDGVALPLPREYISNPYVDQGVDYAAPGGTPLYAMGDGVIVGAGISGFGPNAPILKITSGPLEGLEVYYGHSGPNLVHVGQQVKAGQQISQVGYGIVGISTGPHLEIGFYPPGPMGSGSRMLSVINGLLRQHPSGRVWGTTVASAHAAIDAIHTTRAIAITSGAKTSSTKTATAHMAAKPSASGVRSRGSVSGISSGGVAIERGGSAVATDTASASTPAPATSLAAPTSSAPATSSAAPAGSAPATTSPSTGSSAAQGSDGTSRSPQASPSGSGQGVAVPVGSAVSSGATSIGAVSP
ncbi:MAG: peptidoglycan-binding protein, partial [Solirubrobacterales bacterium]|nr:peptidoglycan-binding protein [Solirubrobacterales bacterium]